MILHEALSKIYNQETLDLILSNAKKLGLDKITYEKTYELKKQGAKNKSSNGYPNSFYVITGITRLIGDDKNNVWLSFNGRGSFEYFKTSPIKNVTKLSETSIEIETENSIYILKEDK